MGWPQLSVCEVILTLGPTFQLLTDKSNKICVVLLSWMVFTLPGWSFGFFLLMWQNISIIRRLSSSLVRIFWPYRITETAFAWCKHQLKPTSVWTHWAAEIPRSYNMFTPVAISVNPSTDSIKPHQTISFQSPIQPGLFVWLKAYTTALHLADVAINHRLALPLQLAAWQMFHNNWGPHPTLPVKERKKKKRGKREGKKKHGISTRLLVTLSRLL